MDEEHSPRNCVCAKLPSSHYRSFEPKRHRSPADNNCEACLKISSCASRDGGEAEEKRLSRTVTSPAGMNFFELTKRLPMTKNKRPATPARTHNVTMVGEVQWRNEVGNSR